MDGRDGIPAPLGLRRPVAATLSEGRPQTANFRHWFSDRSAGRSEDQGGGRLIRLLPLPPVTVMHATKSCRRDLAPQAAARTRGAATQANRQHGSFAPAIAAAKPR